MQLLPLRGYCLIELIQEPETSQSGMIIPDEVKKRQAKGKVLMLGLPSYKPDGKEELIQIAQGDTVWFKQFAGEPIKENGKELLMVPYNAILGVYK